MAALDVKTLKEEFVVAMDNYVNNEKYLMNQLSQVKCYEEAMKIRNTIYLIDNSSCVDYGNIIFKF